MEPTKLERVRAVVDQVFPERQLVMRTDGRVSYFKISQPLQIVMSGVIVAALSWSAFTSVSFLRHDQVLQAKDDEIAGARLAYRSL
ncbi:MAG TPA: hypothetical protein DCG48_02345, partial [Rhodospirillaceae bacterium]|nr:hypothetical protein [Rhodospirillaceae bacterium]